MVVVIIVTMIVISPTIVVIAAIVISAAIVIITPVVIITIVVVFTIAVVPILVVGPWPVVVPVVWGWVVCSSICRMLVISDDQPKKGQRVQKRNGRKGVGTYGRRYAR